VYCFNHAVNDNVEIEILTSFYSLRLL